MIGTVIEIGKQELRPGTGLHQDGCRAHVGKRARAWHIAMLKVTPTNSAPSEKRKGARRPKDAPQEQLTFLGGREARAAGASPVFAGCAKQKRTPARFSSPIFSQQRPLQLCTADANLLRSHGLQETGVD